VDQDYVSAGEVALAITRLG